MTEVELTVNGVPHRVRLAGGESLLDVLREQCGVRSCRNGCQPRGQCGACLALVDGRPKTTCTIPAERAGGRSVVTVEGLPEAERELYARAFVAAGGVQCGFCTPGIVLRTHALLARRPDPSRDEIARALDVHLCRCTGYVRIIEAVQAISRARRGGEPPRPGEDGRVGAPLAKEDGLRLALGERPFMDDLASEDMLHGAVRLSDHARAWVRRIDTGAARALPGVVCVATAADVSGHRRYGLLQDDWPGLVAEGEEVRCVGDVLAAVAATDPRVARRAAALVEVEYEVRQPVLDPHDALEPGAPRVHPGRANLLGRTRLVRGDAEAALAASASTSTWSTRYGPQACPAARSSTLAPTEA